ncbi:hypothetical protein GOP47_0013397 [Adiantum capillus-veneris]|uniref:Dof-type domain-containing protein n=1 Tax=Adiantum capillus-veneris TaxID=13818 RepID=A0A9D4UP55_ADICA|nr:hypothetical protein GOP47_0013397 [Adiantum capillus-veneris]
MDLPLSNCSRKEETRAHPAFMLFGKHIKGPLPTKKIKEELSPRGVDEGGSVSLATSSDEEEDLNAIEQDPIQKGSAHISQDHWKAKKICEEDSSTSKKMQSHKRKIVDSEGYWLAQQSLATRQESEKRQNVANEGMVCQGGGGGGGIAMGKHTFTEKEVKLEGDMQARKRQVGLWSRCPRCNSTETKFCYFNNYNVNQPRHFCKHCQRYWTAGGTLRNVPVGAGKRKNKHALRKDAFFMSPLCESSSTASLDALVDGPDVKSGPMSANANVPADIGSTQDANCQIPSEQSLMVGQMAPINTELELTVHRGTTLPINTSLAFSNTSPLQKPHSLTPLQQLHCMGLANRERPTCSGSTNCGKPCSESAVGPFCLASEVSSDEARQKHPCSNFSGMASNLGVGSSRFGASGSARSSEMSAILQSGADLRSGSCELSDARAYVPSGSCDEVRSSLHVEAKRAPNQPNLDELPSRDQKSASPHHESRHSQINPTFHHGLTLTPSLVNPHSSLGKAQGLAQHNPPSLPLLDPNLWPYFYHMYWLDTLTPPHLKPVLTPQGWAFPFVPPNLEAPSSPTQSTFPTLAKSEFAHTTDTIKYLYH